jgi:anti-sigma B factor antagonist
VGLQLETRRVGKVTIVKCSGRIVAGGEAESLHQHVNRLLPAERHILMDLAEVGFVDSSGLGMLVRLLAAVRSARGELKLCAAGKAVAHTLNITNLDRLFETHASETEAVIAFYQRSGTIESVRPSGKTLLCVEPSADVLAYVREVLRQAGYEPLTTANVADARILIKAVRPDVVILGPNVLDKHDALRHALQGIRVVQLGSAFSTQDAAEAAQQVLEKVKAQVAGK